jgi:hypothetical protein
MGLLKFKGSFGVFELPVPEMVVGVGEDWSHFKNIRDSHPGNCQWLRDGLTAKNKPNNRRLSQIAPTGTRKSRRGANKKEKSLYL